MKTYKCVICGKEVSKRKSVAVEGGRACRHHEDVKAALQANQSKQSAKVSKAMYEKHHQAEILAEKERSRRAEFKGQSDRIKDWLHNRCWSCGKSGLTLQKWYNRLLVGLEKMEFLNEGVDLFNPAKQIKFAGLEGKVPLLQFPFIKSNELEKVAGHMHQMVMSSGVIQVCSECGKKMGFDVESKLKGPAVTAEQLSMISAVYERSDWKKANQRQALSEMAKDN